MKSSHPQNLKGYGLSTHIGEGGFGAVYIATQSSIGREVAIKIIKPAVANKPEFIRRFETEAQLIARLEHPHITPLYDYWRDTTGAYLVMRYLKGGSLRNTIDDTGALELNTTSIILDQLASALDFAHRQQVIHRDIKPDNILLDEEGNIYLADFGIAKDLAINTSNTDPDAVVGSLDYISPEQARSEPVSARTDIYSLGVVLYEMITGDHPFKEVSSVERLYKHINDPLPDIVTLGDVSAMVLDNLNTIIATATRKDPAHRYTDVLSLALAFRDAVGIGDTQEELSIAEQLTMREHEVLQLIAEGLSNQEIADSLFITISGVKFHLRNTYKKLGVNNRVQAIVRSRELDLITTERIADHLSADGQTLQPSTLSLPEPENPYKGLLAFQYGDTRDFFGRDDLSDKLVKRLSDNEKFKRFLAVVGPSGSGKSSLARAGIMPRIKSGDLLNSKNWFVTDMIPGARPLDALEIALIGQASNQPVNLHEQLSRDKFGLVRAAELILPKDNSQLVIIIDQFEEVFTQVADEAARQHFLDLLHATVTDKQSRVYIVVTLRADYYDRPLHYTEFGEMLRSRMDTILPLSAKGLERAISGPAERVGVTFEAGLVAQIVSEMNYQAGALPLLQYALKELFDRRDGRLLTHSAYQEIGGAVGALANRADEIFLSFSENAQSLAQQLFLRLVTLGEGAEDTRRRTPFIEVLSLTDEPDLMEEIIDTFANYRLLSLDTDEQTRQPTVEVAHEAILREWDRLRLWLNESRDDIRQERAVATAAEDWETNNRDNSYLLRGSRLEQTEAWASITRLTLTPLEQDFIQKSVIKREVDTQAETERIKREEAQEKRSRTLLLALVAVFALATILSGGFGFYALGQRNTALDAQAETLVALDVAQRSSLAFAANTALDRDETDLAIALAVESARGDELLPETLRVLERISASGGPRIWVDTYETNCSATLSSDGHYLLASNCEDRLDIWDMTTGERIQTFAAPDVRIYDGEIDSELHHLITYDGVNFTVWDVATGEVLFSFQGPENLWAYFFMGSGSDVWAWTYDAVLAEEGHIKGELILVYDDLTGEVKREYEFPNIQWNFANFSADGTLGIIGGWDDYELKNNYRVHIFDTLTGEVIQTLDRAYTSIPDSGRFGPAPLGFSPDNLHIWFGGFPNYVIDLATGEDVLTIGYGRIQWIDSDFERVAVQETLDNEDIWYAVDLQTGETELLPRLSTARIAPNTNSVIGNVHGAPNSWNVWDLNNRGVNDFILMVSNGWISSSFNPQDNTIASIAGSISNTFINIYDTTTNDLLMTINSQDLEGFDIDWSNDGRYIAAGNHAGEVLIFDAESGEEFRRFTDIDQLQINSIQFTTDSQYVIASFGSPWTGLYYDVPPYITIWDIESGEVIKQIEFPAGEETQNWGIYQIIVNDANSLAYIAVEDTYTSILAFLVDLESAEIIHEFPYELSGVADFTPDGRQLVIGNSTGMIHVISVETGEVIRHWQSLDSNMWRGLTISPNGKYLATGSGPDAFEAAISLWDFQTGELLHRYIGHDIQSFITDIDFNTDSTLISSTSIDGTVRLWEVDPQSSLDWVLENRAVREFTCAERTLYRIEPLCEE